VPTEIVNIMYLISASLFILGLRGLSHPRTSIRGNMMGAAGMLIAVVVTLLDRQIVGYEIIAAGFVVGAAAGTVLALRIQMTAMPQLIGLFNGFGGAASLLVAGAVMIETILITRTPPVRFTVATAFAGLIGSVTFWGSFVAFAKLQGIITEKSVRFWGDQFVKFFFLGVSVLFGVLFSLHPSHTSFYWYLVASSSVLGVLLTVPIGGADMPVVIALLNSYSGLAAAGTGFVLSNTVLIVAGSLVGASGIILTRIMCRAMNRSITNVLIGGIGKIQETTMPDDVYGGKVKSTTSEEVAMLLKAARRIVFIPGYGMAVARAHHAVRVLFQELINDGIEVEFGIHPVAGRMPGHMNVLLAEENIPYDRLKEMDVINPTLEQTDVAIVVGANDVVNPLAREDSGTPISGMPIIEADKARTVVVIKRSLSPGFSGIPNPLFAAENTLMLFGDGQKMIQELINAYKEA
jgi:NAD(P) transhydrogenase subunit beta